MEQLILSWALLFETISEKIIQHVLWYYTHMEQLGKKENTIWCGFVIKWDMASMGIILLTTMYM